MPRLLPTLLALVALMNQATAVPLYTYYYANHTSGVRDNYVGASAASQQDAAANGYNSIGSGGAIANNMTQTAAGFWPQPGALAAGNDLTGWPQTTSIDLAQAACSATAQCTGITYESTDLSPSSSAIFKFYLKTSGSAPTGDNSWSRLLKDRPDSKTTVPLYLFYSAANTDHVLTANKTGPGGSYQLLRVEGFAQAAAGPGLRQLRQYYSASRQDHFLCVEGSLNERNVLAAGTHVLLGVEGYGTYMLEAFCPQYHPIHDGNVYDPSGPILDNSGLWHTWEDDGAWSHWTSRDLIHWSGSFTQNTTHFGADTGSVSPTSSGVYAFWPIMGGPGKGAIGSARATDDTMTSWDQRGPTIPMPARINAGFRDPVRAFEYNDKWFVGVGCGSTTPAMAQFCLFEAHDDTLMNFTDQGALYATNKTFGYVDGNIVWQPNNVSANMMECPDLFPLGDKWVLIGSLYKTNQWWVGTLSGSPPRFTPEKVGILDYGNGYAAKTGTTWIQSGSSRRLVFGFTGWQEPTMPQGCGRNLIIPRELRVVGSQLLIEPIPEASVLRKKGSMVTGVSAMAAGSQVEVRYNCSGAWTTAKGRVGIRTLQAGSNYTEIGYDFGKQAFYADHSNCCHAPNSIIQYAPLLISELDATFSMSVFVDGGVIEAFLNGRVITPLVAPDISAGLPATRQTTAFTTPGVTCQAASWQLAY